KSARIMAAAANRSSGFALSDKQTVSNVGDLAYVPPSQSLDRLQKEVAGERKEESLAKDLAEKRPAMKPDVGSLQEETNRKKMYGLTIPAAPAAGPAEVATRRYRSEEADSKAETAADLPQVKTVTGAVAPAEPRFEFGRDVSIAGRAGALGVVSNQGA